MLKGTKSQILRQIGESLRARRLACNLSQAEAAARSALSVSTVKNIEVGRGASAWALVSLCRTYGHDAWVYALAPDESLFSQVGELEGHVRQRAGKRREGSACTSR